MAISDFSVSQVSLSSSNSSNANSAALAGCDSTAANQSWAVFAQAGPIYAGSNEIQRNIIAERLLGMPK